jgi:GDP-4-dehydro-6-deoxy-D-mannose reductase
MARRVLITGVTGFVGGHLAEALAVRGGAELHGLTRGGQWPARSRHLEHVVALHAADLNDAEAIRTLLAEVRPDWVAHLAAYAHPRNSVAEPGRAWADNVDATRHLYEAVAGSRGSPRILFVSTGLVYGDQPGAVDERTELRPATPYAKSKAAAEELGAGFDLDVVIARPFNHAGPRQSPEYVVARFASQIAAIQRGRQQPVIETGNLDATRDLTDVRDVVRAYVLLLEKGRRGEVYNVGSGVARRIGDVLRRLLEISGVQAEVRSLGDARPGDEAPVADASKLTRETGWRPAIDFGQTLRDTLDYWRGELGP